MKPPELIEVLKQLDQDKSILCQVVDQKGGAWNMDFKFSKPADCDFIVLTVSHPQLKTLPEIPIPEDQ